MQNPPFLGYTANTYTFFLVEGHLYHIAGIRHDFMSSPQDMFSFLNHGDGKPA